MTDAEKELNVASRLLALEGLVNALIGALEADRPELAKRVWPTVEHWIMTQSLQPLPTKQAAVRLLQAMQGVTPILN